MALTSFCRRLFLNTRRSLPTILAILSILKQVFFLNYLHRGGRLCAFALDMSCLSIAANNSGDVISGGGGVSSASVSIYGTKGSRNLDCI